MKKQLLLLLVFFLLPIVYAQQGHMTLLAVRETENGTYEGGTADLYLEIREGSGRVFLETFPLTRTDTQMSTRFAKAIACDLVGKECNDLDFFYTITADSAIIAGPSAGSSIAVLTAAMLEDVNVKKNIAITGTINSGGLIGPVGGLDAKIKAAKQVGLDKVLIPAGEKIVMADNSTIDLEQLAKEIGIKVVEISTLQEAVKEFTGKDLAQKYGDIDINKDYLDTMKSVAQGLCDRGKKLSSQASKLNLSKNATNSLSNAKNLTSKGEDAFKAERYYSAASYCFGANVEYTTLIYRNDKKNPQQFKTEYEKVKKEISDLSQSIEKKEKRTITDLETYIVVKERLAEAKDSVDDAFNLMNSSLDRSTRSLAYAEERLNSAHSWATFFGKPGKVFNLNKDIIKRSCQDKISEASERAQYVELYLPGVLGNVQKQIESATNELKQGNYEICLSQASKAKADVDIILGIFGVEQDQYENLADRKLEIVRNNIARQSSKGIFPILGYSYYEYAGSLKETDVLSSLLYSEYALELGNLDIYFKESQIETPQKKEVIDKEKLGLFAAGFVTGAVVILLIRPNKSKKKRSRR